MPLVWIIKTTEKVGLTETLGGSQNQKADIFLYFFFNFLSIENIGKVQALHR